MSPPAGRQRLQIAIGIAVLFVVILAPALTALAGFPLAALAEGAVLFVASLVAIWALTWRGSEGRDSAVVDWLRIYLPVVDGYLARREAELARHRRHEAVVARMQHALAFYGVGTLGPHAVDAILRQLDADDGEPLERCAALAARLLSPKVRRPSAPVVAALYREQWKVRAPDKWMEVRDDAEALAELAAVVVDSGQLHVQGHSRAEVAHELRQLSDFHLDRLRARLAARPTDRAGELAYLVESEHRLGRLDAGALAGAPGADLHWFCRQASKLGGFVPELAGEPPAHVADLLELLWLDWKDRATAHLWSRGHVRRLAAAVLPRSPRLARFDAALVAAVVAPLRVYSLDLVASTLEVVAGLDAHLGAFSAFLAGEPVEAPLAAIDLLHDPAVEAALPADRAALADLRDPATVLDVLAEVGEPALLGLLEPHRQVEPGEVPAMFLVAAGCYADRNGHADLRRHVCERLHDPDEWLATEILAGSLAFVEEDAGASLGAAFAGWRDAYDSLGERKGRVLAAIDAALAAGHWPRRLDVSTEAAADEVRTLIVPMVARLDELARDILPRAAETSWSAATAEYGRHAAEVLAGFEAQLDDRFGSLASIDVAGELADAVRPELAELHADLEDLGHPSHEELLAELRRRIAGVPGDIEPALAVLAGRFDGLARDLAELKRLDTLKAMLARRGGDGAFDGYLVTFDAHQGPLARLLDCLSHPTRAQREVMDGYGIAPAGRYDFTNYTRYARQGHPPPGLGSFDDFAAAFRRDVELLLRHREELVGAHVWSEVEITLVAFHVSEAVPFSTDDGDVAALLKDTPSIAEFPAA